MKWVFILADSTRRLARWHLRLLEFYCDFIHCASIKHQAAAALPRLKTSDKNKTPFEDSLLIFAVIAPDDNIKNFHIIKVLSDNIILLTATVAPLVNLLPTENKLIFEQTSGPYYQAASVQFGHLNSTFHTDHRGLLTRSSTVDSATQIVIPASLCERIQHLPHHPPIIGHPGQRRMYDMLWSKFFRHHIAADVYGTVAKCASCAKSERILKHKTNFQPFAAVEPLDSVTIDTLGPLLKAIQGNQYVVLITNRYF